ncbi:unnamed protein product, partial [Didymodactylos carnosus]
REQNTTFLINKTQFYVERTVESSFLQKYVTGMDLDSSYELKQPEYAMNDGDSQPILAISGKAGDGKTMLLSKFILYLEVTAVMVYISYDNNLLTSTGERLAHDDNFLTNALKIIPGTIVIIIDGLDKGDIHQNRNYQQEFPLNSLNKLIFQNLSIIISCE